MKVYGVFYKDSIDDLLTSGVGDRQRMYWYNNEQGRPARNHYWMSWYNRKLKETPHGDCYMPAERYGPVGEDGTLCFQLYLEDAKRIRKVYNRDCEIISIDIPEEIVKRNYFLIEIHWADPLHAYSIYNVAVPYSVVEEHRGTINILDHSIINSDDDPKGISEYPAVLRDNLTYRTGFYRYHTNEYFFATLEECTGKKNVGSYYGTILGSLCLPSMDYFLRNNLGKSAFEGSDSAFQILEKALSNNHLYYDSSSMRSMKTEDFLKEYVRVKNHTLLYPTDTLFYHLLTSLIETYGEATFKDLYWRVRESAASKDELRNLIIAAAQTAFDSTYEYHNGILVRKSDNLALDIEKRKTFTING